MLKAKSLKRALRADRGHQRRDVNEIARPAGDLDVIDMGVVADHELERGVDLMSGAGVVALDQHGARALLDHDQRAGEHRGRRLSPVAANTRWIGRSSVAPLATWMTAPSRISAVLSATTPSPSAGTTLPSLSATSAIARRQRLRHRADGQAGRQIGEVGQFRHERAVDEHDAPRIHVADELAGILGARLARRRRAGRRAASPRASARGDRCISTPRPAGAAGRARRSARLRRRAAPRPCGRPAAWPSQPHRPGRAPARHWS